MKKYKKIRMVTNGGLLNYMEQVVVPGDEMLKCKDSDFLAPPARVEALYDGSELAWEDEESVVPEEECIEPPTRIEDYYAGPEPDWEDEESVVSEEECIEPPARIEDYYAGPEPDWEDEESMVPEEEGIEPPTRIEDFYEGLEVNCKEYENSQAVIRSSNSSCLIEPPRDSSNEDITGLQNCMERLAPLELKQKKALEKLVGSNEINPYTVAQRLLDKHRFIYMDPPYKNKTLSFFNGKYWMILNEDIFSSIIYDSMTDEEKKAEKKIKAFINSVKDFIIFECFYGYMHKERKYYFTKEEFKKVEYCTVFSNGIYNVRKGKFYTDLDASKLPYSFAVDAEYLDVMDEHQNTYYMDKLLTDASRDEATVQMAYELLGYLTIPCNNAKCFITLAGVGDSGKSVFGGFCETIFAEERSFRIQPELLGSKFAYSAADMACLYSCLDMETRFLTVKEVSQIKQISGEAYIRTEAKYQNEKTVPVRFKLLLATNGTVQCQPLHEDPAFYRRLQVLPFLYKTEEKDMNAELPKLLQKEKSAILSKAVRALSMCVNGNGIITFHTSELSAFVKDSWKNSRDYDKGFLEEAFEITGNIEDIVCKQDVSLLYSKYCEKNADKMKIRSLSSALCGKIANSDSRIISGSGVKSRKNLDKDFPNPVACFKGIKWNESFLDTYYDKRYIIECHYKSTER